MELMKRAQEKYPKSRILALILHIHTRYDPCENCTKSLVKFNDYVQTTFKFPSLVTVSSRTAYDHARDMKGFDGNFSQTP